MTPMPPVADIINNKMGVTLRDVSSQNLCCGVGGDSAAGGSLQGRRGAGGNVACGGFAGFIPVSPAVFVSASPAASI